MKKYVVTINSSYLRDAQIYVGKDYNLDNDNSWNDFYPNHFVGIYEAKSKKEAIKQASLNNQLSISHYAYEATEANSVTYQSNQENNDVLDGQMSIQDFI